MGKAQWFVKDIKRKKEGWSDELADLVSKEVTENKPIVQTSINHSISQLKQWVSIVDDTVILEVGCSNGFLLKRIRDIYPNAKIIGSDFIFKPLKNMEVVDAPLVQFDITNCPVKENSIDCVIISNVLEHVKDDKKAVTEIYRALKPNGVVIIEVPAGQSLYDIFDKIVYHWRRYNMSELRNLLENSGFEIVFKSHIGFLVFPLFWIGKKKNRRLFKSSKDIQKQVVLETLRAGKRNIFLKVLFVLESMIRQVVYLPCGIRCVITCRKV